MFFINLLKIWIVHIIVDVYIYIWFIVCCKVSFTSVKLIRLLNGYITISITTVHWYINYRIGCFLSNGYKKIVQQSFPFFYIFRHMFIANIIGIGFLIFSQHSFYLDTWCTMSAKIWGYLRICTFLQAVWSLSLNSLLSS